MANDQHLIDHILEGGHATQEQIDDALAVREKMVEMGMRPRSVAEILFEKGVLEREQFEEIRRTARRFEGKEQIAGYRLLEALGEGAMGAVYKARQLSLDREVAIKVLSPELADDASYVKRFMTEARAVARLNHTNIISGIDVGDADGIKYLVMEYADGMTVASLLRRGGAMDEERSLWIGLQMARALDHAHRSDLVHRDVKPDNIIITKDGVAKLCDLGLARTEADEGEPARMGTAAYISPEQARGGAVDERTDLYSLGATLFHMMTGRVPYEGNDASAVLAMHLTSPVPTPRSVDANISEATEGLIMKLLAKDPADRVPTAKELVSTIEDLVKALRHERGAMSNMPASTRSKPMAPPTAGAAKPKPAAPHAPVRRRRRRR